MNCPVKIARIETGDQVSIEETFVRDVINLLEISDDEVRLTILQ